MGPATAASGGCGIERFLGPATAASGGSRIIGGIPGGRRSADLARWRDGHLAGSVRTVADCPARAESRTFGKLRERGGSADLARLRDGHLAGSVGTVPACFAPADTRPFGELGGGDLGEGGLDEEELDEEELEIGTIASGRNEVPKADAPGPPLAAATAASLHAEFQGTIVEAFEPAP